MRRTSNSKIFFKLLSDEIDKSGKEAIVQSLRSVLSFAKSTADQEISSVPKSKYSTGRYADSFRYAVSYGKLSSFKETTYNYGSIGQVLKQIDSKLPQTIVMYNIARNPLNGYPYHLNVDELGWKTIGKRNRHPVSAKHPFTPTKKPWAIITKVKAALQNHPYLRVN